MSEFTDEREKKLLEPKNWNSLCSSGLRVNRVLGSFADGRRVACLCDSESSSSNEKGKTILVLEKPPISESEIVELLSHKESRDSLSLILANDIYCTFNVTPHSSSNLNTLRAVVVKPATEQHISKYSFCANAVICETPELYNKVTKPYILEKQLGLRWVYNILDGLAEADRILYSDPDPVDGFVLLPDMKWDGVSDPKRGMYLVAIVRRRDIFSLRDLTVEHLPLLDRLATVVPDFITRKYGIPVGDLRIFFHYLPSYWHLHVHFVVGQFASEESGASGGLWSAERAHWLSSVIANIRLQPNFYQLATVVYSVRKDNPLYSELTASCLSEKANNGKTESCFNNDSEPANKTRRLDIAS